MHVWVFALKLPGQPTAAWTAVQRSLEINFDRYKSKSEVFHAANQLWRFVISSSLHAIWVEHLNRMRDPTLPGEAHISRATSHLRRALTRFRSSVYQSRGGENGQILAQVRSALSDTLLLHDEPVPLRPTRLVDQPGVPYLISSTGDLEEILGRAGLAPSLSRFTYLLTQRPSCGWPAWRMEVQLL